MAPRWQPRPIRIPDVAPDINTTPLIDLLLVLLVMLILSVPIATHKVPLDVPPPGPTPVTPPPVHRLDLDSAGRFFWDGRPIADAELAPRLARHAADPAGPVLHFAADAETRYQRVDETLTVILSAGVTRMGFVGNDRFLAMLDRRRP